MAQVIEFYIPRRFKPKVKWIPLEQRGRFIAFPDRLEKVGVRLFIDARPLRSEPGVFCFGDVPSCSSLRSILHFAGKYLLAAQAPLGWQSAPSA